MLSNHLDLARLVERIRRDVEVQVGTSDVLKPASHLEQLVENVLLDEGSCAIWKNEFHVNGIADRVAHVPKVPNVTDRHKRRLQRLDEQLPRGAAVEVNGKGFGRLS